MTIASEIARLQAAKVDIMAALVEKGVDVTGKNLVDVPGLIDSISIHDFLFLTYFDNFNSSASIDTPIVGEPYSLGTNFSLSSLNVSWGTINSIKCEYRSNVWHSWFSMDIPPDAKYISAEMFIYSGGDRYDYSSSLTMGVGPKMTFDPYFRSDTFPRSGPHVKDLSSYTLYNGSSVVDNYLSTGTNIRHKLVHLAEVTDLETHTTWFYVDGLLMYSVVSNLSGKIRIDIRQGNTGKYFDVSGICIVPKNKSINNGMNYPVPTEPYRI